VKFSGKVGNRPIPSGGDLDPDPYCDTGKTCLGVPVLLVPGSASCLWTVIRADSLSISQSAVSKHSVSSLAEY